jgi:hypothetical protein
MFLGYNIEELRSESEYLNNETRANYDKVFNA